MEWHVGQTKDRFRTEATESLTKVEDMRLQNVT